MKRYERGLSVVGIILTLVVLMFGNNFYQQLTGRLIGDDLGKIFEPATEVPIEISSATPSDVIQPTNTPVEISAHCGYFENSPSYAKEGQEIILRWRWLAKTKAYVQEYLDSVTFSLQIDGVEVDTLSATITLKPYEEGGYVAYWFMPSRLLSDGTHHVLITVDLGRQVTDGFDNDNDGNIDTFGPGIYTFPPCEIIVE